MQLNGRFAILMKVEILNQLPLALASGEQTS
ncbi:MAG: hypothetical protein ACJAWV_002610 [Flammeovirgaceae bacterium]|jgi:hypothetical protein